MVSSHRFQVDATSPQKQTIGGSRIDVTQKELAVLRGISLSFLHLHPKGMREPHWHPNANELSYCLEGRALMTVFSPGAVHDTFVIEPGVLAFVPMGSIHHIENIGEGPVKLLICFDHEMPEDLNLSSSVAVMPSEILGETFKQKSDFFKNLHAQLSPTFIGEKPRRLFIDITWMTNRLKMNLEETHPQVQTKGGAVKMSNDFLMPALNGLAMYSLILEPKGAREPHWHPNAHELNYLISGQARITLLSPNGEVDTFDMEPGDMSFLPRGYLHHIENTGDSKASFAIFFNHAAPSDIGLSGCLGAYSNEVLASLFNVPGSYFEHLPKYQHDLFVVGGG